MKQARSNESCRSVSISPALPSSTSWWADEPAQPHGVHRYAVHPRPAGPVGVVGGRVRHVAAVRPRTGPAR